MIDNLLDDNNQENWQQLQQVDILNVYLLVKTKFYLIQTSPETSQSLVNSTEKFGRLLGATLNNKTNEAIKTKKNISKFLM